MTDTISDTTIEKFTPGWINERSDQLMRCIYKDITADDLKDDASTVRTMESLLDAIIWFAAKFHLGACDFGDFNEEIAKNIAQRFSVLLFKCILAGYESRQAKEND